MAVNREEILDLCRTNPEAIVDIIERQDQIIAQLTEKIVQLEARITELEARLNRNSQNSSQPPSMDGYRRPRAHGRKERNHPEGRRDIKARLWSG